MSDLWNYGSLLVTRHKDSVQDITNKIVAKYHAGIRNLVVAVYYDYVLGRERNDELVKRTEDALEACNTRFSSMKFYMVSCVKFYSNALADLATGRIKSAGTHQYFLLDFEPDADKDFIVKQVKQFVAADYKPIIYDIFKYESLDSYTDLDEVIQAGAYTIAVIRNERLSRKEKERMSNHFKWRQIHFVICSNLREREVELEKLLGTNLCQKILYENVQCIFENKFID